MQGTEKIAAVIQQAVHFRGEPTRCLSAGSHVGIDYVLVYLLLYLLMCL